MTLTDFTLGQHVQLSAKTQHGKNRLAQHGKVWVVEKIGGPKVDSLLLRSLEKTFKKGPTPEHDLRWVKIKGLDPDFSVSPLTEEVR